MHLSDLQFPIYAIAKNYKRIWEDLNVLYIETDSGTYVLDNRNMEGDSLGARRLRLKGSDMFIPRKVYYNVSQLVHSSYKDFIDNSGKVFKWKMSTNVPLKYHKVRKLVETDNGCIIHLKDIEFPQLVNCRIAHVVKYVGVLHTNDGYIVYEYCEAQKKDTYRKI